MSNKVALIHRVANPGASMVALALVVICGCMGTTVTGQQGSGGTGNRLTQQGSTDAANVMFRTGRDLITEQEWTKAQEKFNQYISSYPNEKNVDAALYWLAYAQIKLAKFEQCRETITRLLNKYPTTSWKEDARLLLAQVPGVYVVGSESDGGVGTGVRVARAMTLDGEPVIYSSGASLTPNQIQAVQAAQIALDDANNSSAADDDPCEFKIVVLQALFQTDVQRGVVAATEWLKPGSTQTVRCKGAALSLLGRNGGKAVTPVILGVARSEPDLKLRARAISALGVTNDDSVVDALRDFALNSQENEIVEASLYALSRHTGERAVAVLAEIATSAKPIGQRKVAIASIASRPGEPSVDALLRIYDADQSLEIRKTVISGFANRKSQRAGNKLLEIARTSDTIDLRKAAISAISRRGGEQAIDTLLNLYDSEKSEELKDQIINALGSGMAFYATQGYGGQVSGQVIGSGSRLNDQRVVRKLIEIAKNPQTPMERRKRAIGWLSRSKDPEVLRFLEELLK